MKKDLQNTLVKDQNLTIKLDKEYRCPVCNRLLMRGQVIRIKTRCPKCKRMITIHE